VDDRVEAHILLSSFCSRKLITQNARESQSGPDQSAIKRRFLAAALAALSCCMVGTNPRDYQPVSSFDFLSPWQETSEAHLSAGKSKLGGTSDG
jgi:hypothetical protein